MEAKDRIIAALDVPTPNEGMDLVRRLNGHVGMYKLGLEFVYGFLRCLGTVYRPASHQLLDEYLELFKLLNGNVFLDCKLHDIPNTVIGATYAISDISVKMFNVHCAGGRRMLSAARNMVLKMMPQPLLLGVTALTSMSDDDMVVAGTFPNLDITDPAELERAQNERMARYVLRLAHLAQDNMLDGIICSPKEIDIVRRSCRNGFLIVTPGVRPAWANEKDDQKRVMTPGDAIKAGADYLVIGRPITSRIKRPLPDVTTPEAAADLIAQEIAAATETP